MKKTRIEDVQGGWFIGNFEPTLRKTADFETAVKYYKKGQKEDLHFHKIATEYTVIVSGKARMNGIEFVKGDIVLISPGESTDFKALEDTITTVVKIPSIKGDKFIGENKK